MPSDIIPRGEPKIRETNVTKPISVEEFKKLKVGDRIYAITNPFWNPDRSTDVDMMIISEISEDYVALRMSEKVYPISFSISDFLNKYKIFPSRRDAQEEIGRTVSVN